MKSRTSEERVTRVRGCEWEALAPLLDAVSARVLALMARRAGSDLKFSALVEKDEIIDVAQHLHIFRGCSNRSTPKGPLDGVGAVPDERRIGSQCDQSWPRSPP